MKMFCVHWKGVAAHDPRNDHGPLTPVAQHHWELGSKVPRYVGQADIGDRD